jgi:hypothetical protein
MSNLRERVYKIVYRVAYVDRLLDPAVYDILSLLPDAGLREKLNRAREDIYWMLNNGKLLNANVFDYLDDYDDAPTTPAKEEE